MRGPRSVIELIALLGPTAVGKTALAIQLASALNAEIVSVDSRQVYRYMDIGTAKPTLEERAAVRHHLVDCVDPDEAFSAAEFQRLADQAIEDIQTRNRRVLLVGGSGLYFRAIVDGLFKTPPIPPELRTRLREELEARGAAAMHARLAQVDPQAAARIHPNDAVRIMRALEVYEATGVPISQQQRQWHQAQPRYPFRAFVLHRPRSELYERIHRRVDAMLDQGLVQEVQALLDRGYSRELRSMQSLGYREIIEYLEGHCDLETAVEQLKQNTRRYAKRQLTWFRGDSRLQWVEITQDEDVSRWLERLGI